MTTNSAPTFIHQSREENLTAAKRAVRRYRQARIHRHTDLGEDVIDIMIGADVAERHICHSGTPYPQAYLRQRFRVEDLALYR